MHPILWTGFVRKQSTDNCYGWSSHFNIYFPWGFPLNSEVFITPCSSPFFRWHRLFRYHINSNQFIWKVISCIYIYILYIYYIILYYIIYIYISHSPIGISKHLPMTCRPMFPPCFGTSLKTSTHSAATCRLWPFTSSPIPSATTASGPRGLMTYTKSG